jgi:glycogen debranching enzyme
LAKRISQTLSILSDADELFILLSPKKLVFWFSQLHNALEFAKNSYCVDGLFKNDFCETWMDTSFNDDGREGFRIEVQAGILCLYDSLISLAKLIDAPLLSELVSQRKDFRHAVRLAFLQPHLPPYLLDGLSLDRSPDETFRPNVFLAAYLAQDLCSKDEWLAVFNVHLNALWHSWGGLSTLPVSHSLFSPYYTGENNKSYHRGDSWYFLNSLVGVVLNQCDSKKFSLFVDKLLSAGAKDILDLGYMGHGSEVSNALVQSGSGCLAQAWSVSAFLELYFSSHD